MNQELHEIRTLWIQFTFPGLNEVVTTCKGQWGKHKYHKLKADYEGAVIALAKSKRFETITVPVNIDFIWCEPDKRRDPDNIAAGGRKIILDALVYGGFMQGDGWGNVLGFSDSFRVNKDEKGVLISFKKGE